MKGEIYIENVNFFGVIFFLLLILAAILVALMGVEVLKGIIGLIIPGLLTLVVATVVINMFGLIVGVVKDDLNDHKESYYDDTPDNWGPGYDSGDSNPGYHEVDGYYNSNGTYVEPYLRTNPDGYEGNNFNN